MFLSRWLLLVKRNKPWRSGPPGACRLGATFSRPRVEPLEDRTLTTVAVPPGPFLFTPVADNVPLAVHHHFRLAILIDGRDQTIPDRIGIVGRDEADPIHTHDSSGLIHIESPVPRDFRLGDFFAIWGQPFDRESVLGFHAVAPEQSPERFPLPESPRFCSPDPAWGTRFTREDIPATYPDTLHPVTLTVNNRPSAAFGSLVLHDGDKIVIRAGHNAGTPAPAEGL